MISGASEGQAEVASPFEEIALAELQSRTSIKWQLYPRDVLPMWVAEMDVRLADPVVAAVRRAIETGDTGYPAGRAYQEAFAAFAGRQWGWTPDIDGALVVADVMTGIRHALLAATEPGGTVVIPTPVYPPFLGFARELGRRVVEVPMTAAGDASLRLDIHGIAAGLASSRGGRSALLLCSPHNPTGTVHTAEELAALVQVARSGPTTVIADEIHAPLTFGNLPFIPYLSLPGTEADVVVTSASKAFNLAAMKSALVLPGSRARQLVAQFGEHVKYGASHFGVLSHAAALAHGDQWLTAVNSNIAANHGFLGALLAGSGLPLTLAPAQATYLAWMDARPLGLGPEPAVPLREIGRVAFNPGSHFGRVGIGHVRINVATSRANLEEAVNRIQATASAAA